MWPAAGPGQNPGDSIHQCQEWQRSPKEWIFSWGLSQASWDCPLHFHKELAMLFMVSCYNYGFCMDGSSTVLWLLKSHLEEKVTPEEPWLHPGQPSSLQGKASQRWVSDQQEVFKNPKFPIFVFYDQWFVCPFNIFLLTRSCHFSYLQFIYPGTSRTFINREFSLWWTALKPFFKEKEIYWYVWVYFWLLHFAPLIYLSFF